jgi:four helix bundle protein
MTKEIRSHRDLIVWQKSVDLAVETYRMTRLLPPEERFILRPQMLRAAISIPSNIAEGHGQLSKGSYLSHLGYSRGSVGELDTQFEIAQQVGYFETFDRAASLIADVRRMLWVLMERLGGRTWR